MRIIPAIDIIDGQCVRLTKGDYSTRKTYNENPLEVAKMFEDAGLKYLHLVDLDGAKAQHIVNYKTLEEIATKTALKIDFGGGLKTDEDLHIAFNSGAQQITGGSIAVKNPKLFETWISKYGQDKIILGADSHAGTIAVSGWQEQSSEALIPFIKKHQAMGIKYVVCTDIAKDGMLEGASVSLYKDIITQCTTPEYPEGIKLIASGGVSDIAELEVLKTIGCEGAIIGKAIYEYQISLSQLESFI